MAVPIRTIPETKPSNDEILAQLEQARIRHAEAIVAAYKLVQALHDAGILDTCRGMAEASDTLVTKLSLAASSEESIDAMRNLISLGRLLSTIDPEFLHRLSSELASHRRGKPKEVNAWIVVKALFGRDGRRAITGASAFVRAFGRALAKPHSEVPRR